MTTVPEDARRQDGWRFVLDLVLAPDGTAAGVIEATGLGLTPAILRRALAVAQPSERRALLEAWLRKSLPGASIDDLSVAAAEDPDRPLVVRVQLSGARLLERSGDRLEGGALVPGSLGRGLSGTPVLEDYLRLPVRRTPLRLEPYHETLTLRLAAPPGGSFQAAPRDAAAERAGARFEQRVSMEPSRVELTREVRLGEGRVLPATFPDFAAFVRSFRDAARAPVQVDL